MCGSFASLALHMLVWVFFYSCNVYMKSFYNQWQAILVRIEDEIGTKKVKNMGRIHCIFMELVERYMDISKQVKVFFYLDYFIAFLRSKKIIFSLVYFNK